MRVLMHYALGPCPPEQVEECLSLLDVMVRCENDLSDNKQSNTVIEIKGLLKDAIFCISKKIQDEYELMVLDNILRAPVLKWYFPPRRRAKRLDKRT